MKSINHVLFLMIILSSCKGKIEQNETSHPIISYLDKHRVEPTTFIINEFQDHDVIFLGENHWIKQQVEFVKDLIPELYENGIYYLGTEFLNFEDTELANQLINGEVFDQDLAQEISFKSDWMWGYKEYLDIYYEAWKLNKNLPEDADKFRIFGIQEVIDYSYVKKEEDLRDPAILQKVFSGYKDFDEDEGYSAFAIQTEVLDKGEKALIHCGINHAFTSYFQPHYNADTQEFTGSYEKERVGNLVKNKIGDKAITIFIHGPWDSKNGIGQVFPVDGILDSLLSIKDFEKLAPFGVDTKDTPFANLKGETSDYKYGYPNFSLKDFCDGYIFLEPINEYQAVTAIPDFIKPKHVAHIKEQEFDYREKELTADNLNDSIRIWLIEQEQILKALTFTSEENTKTDNY